MLTVDDSTRRWRGRAENHRVKYTTGAESSETEERIASVKVENYNDSSTRITITLYSPGFLGAGTEC